MEGYRQAFSSRYGADREVALLELLDPERGLGPPSRHGSGPTVDAEAEAARRAWLRTTAAEALRTRRLTVRLKEPDVTRLAGTGPPPDLAPISVDLSCFVLAGSAEDVDSGDFRLLIGPNLGAQAAGRTLGRFADLLGPTAAVPPSRSRPRCVTGSPVGSTPSSCTSPADRGPRTSPCGRSSTTTR